MSDESTLFLFVTGAGTCVRVPELVRELIAEFYGLFGANPQRIASHCACLTHGSTGQSLDPRIFAGATGPLSIWHVACGSLHLQYL